MLSNPKSMKKDPAAIFPDASMALKSWAPSPDIGINTLAVNLPCESLLTVLMTAPLISKKTSWSGWKLDPCTVMSFPPGPDGGERGGNIVAEGTPEMVSTVKKSYTGQFLEKILQGKKAYNI